MRNYGPPTLASERRYVRKKNGGGRACGLLAACSCFICMEILRVAQAVFPTSYGAYQKSSGLLRCLGDMLGAAMPPAALPPHGNSSHVWIAYVEYDQEASYT